jgi:hypothetical protein
MLQTALHIACIVLYESINTVDHEPGLISDEVYVTYISCPSCFLELKLQLHCHCSATKAAAGQSAVGFGSMQM